MIRINIASKRFGDRILFKNYTLSICENDFVVLTGPSGVGKSSLLNIIGLLDNDYSGYYQIFNNEVEFKSYKSTVLIRRKYFGYIFQDSLINERQSIIRNLLCSVDYPQLSEARKHITHILKLVGLPNSNCLASLLSGGEKQRLALARALIKHPRILLADEPTASLDAENKIKVMNILKDFHKNGGTVIMITHDVGLITPDMKVINIA
ncbi:TPA: ABC transporter ATP-binding protein [Salmonella enterica]|uniref:ABC transporter ATP-binding protein n=1 Tax=Salmonella enterica TaxID=28901 RepID=A0A759GR86_SALER|nr:ABC transporter ATP-binding protein [Salmonella enterica]HAF8192387.1 ABC transporter ATP-binding protein [Salmonella enterica]HAF8215708.1 ABC transporter ATP-binding protein [Salmonella enterica]HAF8243839.1 ABC transporter ATP-binding protein [Salmonella enterica]HAF8248630.1 ABC transporter ATP-binding protein [Salmonella enterica]